MSARFREEQKRFRLVFSCEDCASFHEGRQACSVLYPTEPHRKAHVEGLEDGERLYFCKMFEAR